MRVSASDLFLLVTVGCAAAAELRSTADPALQPVMAVVRAEPYARPGDNALLAAQGYYRLVYEPLGTIPAQRLRLPVPAASSKLTGRVGRLADGTIVAGFGQYLYWSRDEGRSWTGRHVTNLPHTKGPLNARAFGVGKRHIYLAHEMTAEAPIAGADRVIHPLAIARSADLGAVWDQSARVPIPLPYTFLAGDGNHIVELGDGSLVAALDAANAKLPVFAPGWLAQIFFRSRDEGRTWGDHTLIADAAAEVGLLPLGRQRLMAANRGTPNSRLGGKTIQLAESDDGGRNWHGHRQVTWDFGQAHGDLAQMPGGAVVAVYENRYPVPDSDIRARVSWDMGRSWEPEVYILSKGVGYAGSVVMADGTIVTVLGDGEHPRGKERGRGYTLQAIRWKPWPMRRP